MPLRFPTDLHERVADITTGFFAGRPGVQAVLVTASCARGAAEPESDLDMVVFAVADAKAELEREWESLRASNGEIAALIASSLYAQLHLDIETELPEPAVWDDGGGPDDFEVVIGNLVAHPAPIWTDGSAFEQLQTTWLPYYGDDLRAARLAMVKEACVRDLDFIPFYVRRELYFQAFDRLYKAFQEFLQALFIARGTYPVTYRKWIRWQVAELLGDAALYRQLPPVLEISRLEGDAVLENAALLRRLLEAEAR